PGGQVEPLLLRGAAGPRAVFVDGRHAPALSSRVGLPQGVVAGSLAAALQAGGGSELARAHLARHAAWRESPFAALNTAFLLDGAFVHIPAGIALEQPLELLFISTGQSLGPTVTHPRCLVVVDRGAEAAVIEHYVSLARGLYWTNAVTEVVVGDEARVEYYRVQGESRDAYHVATTHSQQGRDSYLGLHVVTLGPLDQTALYYLRSRGLSRETAQSLLTYGFAAEILGRMRRPEVRERLDQLVRDWLGSGAKARAA